MKNSIFAVPGLRFRIPRNQSLDLYLRGRRGLAAAQRLASIDTFTPGFARIREEKGVLEDVRPQILRIVEDRGFTVTCERKTDVAPDPATFSLAVGWDLLINVSGTTLVVLHDSILPSLRGWNPLVSALLTGKRKSGVTAFLAGRNFDCGFLLVRKTVALGRNSYCEDALKSVERAIGFVVGRLFIPASSFERLLINLCGPQPSLSPWRNELDYEIDWTKSSVEVVRQIRALSAPYLGASTQLNGEIVRVTRARLLASPLAVVPKAPGKVLFAVSGWLTGTGSGAIEVGGLVSDGERLPVVLQSLKTNFGRPGIPGLRAGGGGMKGDVGYGVNRCRIRFSLVRRGRSLFLRTRRGSLQVSLGLLRWTSAKRLHGLSPQWLSKEWWRLSPAFVERLLSLAEEGEGGAALINADPFGGVLFVNASYLDSGVIRIDESKRLIVFELENFGGYGHFLAEVLPVAVWAVHSGWKVIRVGGTGFFRSAFQKALAACENGECSWGGTKELSNLGTLVSVVGANYPSLRGTTLLRHVASSLRQQENVQDLKYFVLRGRGSSRSRFLLNEDEIAGLAEEFGFELLRPESLPFEKQIETFRAASHVIGTHGSALFNCSFMAPGSSVIEIAPQFDYRWGVVSISHLVGLQHSVVWGGKELGESGFTLPLANFQRHMDKVL